MATRDFSIVQEKRIAKKLNGRVVANSGATNFDKGDVVIERADILVECKTSTKPKISQSVKLEWLKEIQQEARAMGMSDGVVAIDFGIGDDFFIINEQMMMFLVDKLEEEYATTN